ncbi:MAG TPA: phage head-tail connector protein [Pseudolabrys sp.]
MSSFLLTAPAAEPLTLDEARAFLRVDTHDDDETIAALIVAARLHIEMQTRRALITQGWRLTLDGWPADGRIPVRPGPLRELTAARVYDFSGTATALDLQHFVPDLGVCELAVAPWALMQPTRLAAGIELEVSVGYGDTALDVPEPLRHAARLLVAHWYENRGLIVPGATSLASLPVSAAALIAPYRMVSL